MSHRHLHKLFREDRLTPKEYQELLRAQECAEADDYADAMADAIEPTPEDD